MGDGLDLTLLPAAVSPLVAAEVAGAPRRVPGARRLPDVPLPRPRRARARPRRARLGRRRAAHRPSASPCRRRASAGASSRAARRRGARVGSACRAAEVVAARRNVRPACALRRASRAALGCRNPASWATSPTTSRLAALAGRSVERGRRGLVGVGRGLTPSGDDALCGVLLALARRRRAERPDRAGGRSRTTVRARCRARRACRPRSSSPRARVCRPRRRAPRHALPSRAARPADEPAGPTAGARVAVDGLVGRPRELAGPTDRTLVDRVLAIGHTPAATCSPASAVRSAPSTLASPPEPTPPRKEPTVADHVELRSRRLLRLRDPHAGVAQPSPAPRASRPPRSPWPPSSTSRSSRGMGFDVPDGAAPNDLVVAIRGDDAGLAAGSGRARGRAGRSAGRRGRRSGGFGDGPAAADRSAARSAARAPTSRSSRCPGEHAVAEALDAIARRGLGHGVLRQRARRGRGAAQGRRGRRATCSSWGPTAAPPSSAGVALGFANVVRPGSVGHRRGLRHRRPAGHVPARRGRGRRQPLPRRRRPRPVGRRRAAARPSRRSPRSPPTRRPTSIVVVSKPPAAEVLADLEAYAAGARQAGPLGDARGGPSRPDGRRRGGPGGDRPRRCPSWPDVAPGVPTTRSERRRAALPRRGVRCAASSAAARSPTRRCSSPARCSATSGPTSRCAPELALGPDLRDAGHVVIDFGDDALTQGRAHPMIDPSLRLERIAAEARRPDAAASLLLDLVLGHGAHADPAPELAEAIRAARAPPPPTAATCRRRLADRHRGRPAGPRAGSADRLVDAGAVVDLSNAGATREALRLLGHDVTAPASATGDTADATEQGDRADAGAEPLHGLLDARRPRRCGRGLALRRRPAGTGRLGRPRPRGSRRWRARPATSAACPRRPATRRRQRRGAAPDDGRRGRPRRRAPGARGAGARARARSCTPVRRSSSPAPPGRSRAR